MEVIQIKIKHLLLLNCLRYLSSLSILGLNYNEMLEHRNREPGECHHPKYHFQKLSSQNIH